MPKRLPKKGYIYLAKTLNDDVYKFGCSINPENRVKKLHYKNPYSKEKFTILYKKKSKDMFHSECLLKWFLWHKCFAFYEYFGLDTLQGVTETEVIDKINEVCDV